MYSETGLFTGAESCANHGPIAKIYETNKAALQDVGGNILLK
jgi:hypothetical protein